MINSDYLQLLSQRETEEESKAEIRLLLVAENDEEGLKYQLLKTNSETPIQTAVEIEFNLLQDLRVRMVEENDLREQKLGHKSNPHYYWINWHSLDLQRSFNRRFLHQDLLNSRSRAVAFFRNKARRGHLTILFMVKEEAVSTFCLSTTSPTLAEWGSGTSSARHMNVLMVSSFIGGR